MKDPALSKLSIAYACLALLYLALGIWWQWISSGIRAFLLSIAFAAIVTLQVTIVRKIDAAKFNKPFFLFTLLWCLQLAFFLTEEILAFLWGQPPVFLSFFQLLFLVSIGLITTVSFLIRKPFWYIQVEGKSYVFIGILLLIICGWLAVVTVLAIIDHVRLGNMKA